MGLVNYRIPRRRSMAAQRLNHRPDAAGLHVLDIFDAR